MLNDPNIKGDIIDRLLGKFRNLRPKLKGWNRNMNAWYIELKKDILLKLDIIDKNCEINGLTAADRKEQIALRAQLDRLLKQEEAKWKQRAKINEILEGDSNTKFFHAKANGRLRRNKINRLEQAEGIIEGDKNLIDYITTFYKKLFGPPDNSSVSLNIDNPIRIQEGCENKLVEEASLEEMKKVVFKMTHNKSPRR